MTSNTEPFRSGIPDVGMNRAKLKKIKVGENPLNEVPAKAAFQIPSAPAKAPSPYVPAGAANVPLNGAQHEQANPLNAVAATAQRDQLEAEAQKWVAQTFFGALLKQMRESPFRSELFDGGRGGQAFGSVYDQELAQRMAQGSGQKLVRAIVRSIEKRKVSANQAKKAYGASPKANGLEEAVTKVKVHVAPSLRA